MIPELLLDAGIAIAAIGLLWKGADWVVYTATRVARRFELSEVVIGATIVALGTSAPEIVVTLVAAINGHDDIAVANVVGSNIFNVGFILGGCAVLTAIPTSRLLVQRYALTLLASCVLLSALMLPDATLSRFEGLAMILILLAFLAYMARTDSSAVEAQDEIEDGRGGVLDGVGLLLSLGAIGIGASLLVKSAVSLAETFGMSEWAIGLTIVAAGTSLPELATALMAVRHGRTELMVGTLIGSDIFNVLGVLGLAAILRPLEIDAGATPSVVMMVGMVFFLLLFMRTGWRLTRVEGLALIALAALRWSRDLAPSLWPAGLWN